MKTLLNRTRGTKAPLAAIVVTFKLSACGIVGGGGGSEPAETPEREPRPGQVFTVADLPDGLTGSVTYSLDDRRVYRVSGGVYSDVGIDTTNALVYCPPSVTSCRYRVTEEGEVETTNGATVVLNSEIRISPEGVSPPPAGDDYLSAETLAQAFRGMGSGRTIWSEAGKTIDLTTGSIERTTVEGETLELTASRLGTDTLYWGHWDRYRDPLEIGNRSNASRGTFFGGAERYAAKPAEGIDAARYEEDDSVRYYYRRGSGQWIEGEEAANLNLVANFRFGKVGGKITGIAGANVILKETDITDAGTFAGSAAFSGTTVTRNGGSWNGAFYGPVTEVEGTTERFAAPSHAAGEFSVAGRLGADASTDLRINGAFGAAAQ